LPAIKSSGEHAFRPAAMDDCTGISFGAAARKGKWRSMNFAHKSMQIYAAYWITAFDI
jgi:hypothetical protein